MGHSRDVGCDDGSESGRLRSAAGESLRRWQASIARDETDTYLGPLMDRPWRGHVFERPWADGETVSYGTQVRAYGRYERVTFGTNKQGRNRTRAELEAERIAQQIERGTWVPPRLEPRRGRLEDAMAGLVFRLTRPSAHSLHDGGAPSSST